MKRLLLLVCVFIMAFAIGAAAEEIVTVDLYQVELLGAEGAEDSKLSADERAAVSTIEEGIRAFEEEIDIKQYTLTPDSVNRIFQVVVGDNPEFYYLDNTYSYSIGGNRVFSFIPIYKYAQDELAEKDEAIEAELLKVLGMVDDSFTDYEKALFVHNYLASNFEYDYSYEIRDIYNFFENKKGVCQAYTLAASYYLRAMGVECVSATSTSMNHTWNMVKVDDRWYHMDVTHDDPSVNGAGDILGYCSYENFLKSDDAMEDNGYRAWVCENDAQDTRYDRSYLDNYQTPILYLDGKWYVQSDRVLYEINIENGNKKQIFKPIVLNAPWSWYAWEDSMNFAVYNDGFVYNSDDEIYYISLEDMKPTKIKEFELDDYTINGLTADNGRIYYQTGSSRYSYDICVESFEITDSFELNSVKVEKNGKNVTITVDYNVDVLSDEACKIYVAGYKDGSLAFVKALTDTNTVNAEEAEYYKAFIWDETRPLCESLRN